MCNVVGNTGRLKEQMSKKSAERAISRMSSVISCCKTLQKNDYKFKSPTLLIAFQVELITEHIIL